MWRLLLCSFIASALVPAPLAAEPDPSNPAPSMVMAAQMDTIQPGETLQEVRLMDGSVLFGRVTEVTAQRISLETAGGVSMELDRAQIRSVRPARGELVNGQFWRTDPNRTRLFFAPTARPLERGDGYVANYMLFFPFMGYGVTDRFTMAGGTPILPGIIGEVFYLAPKVTVASRPGMDLAVGALAFFAAREVDEGSIGILYGSGTFGGVERAVTAGAGWGYAITRREGSTISNDPVLMLGAEHRAGENTKLLTENWFFFGDGDSVGLLTGGVRFFGERLSADLGLGLGMDGGGVECCLPLVNFVYNFGGR